MRWARTSFADQASPGTGVSFNTRSSYRASTASSSVRAARRSARKVSLLTLSLAARRDGSSGEGGLELREVRVDRPGVAGDAHDRAEQRVVDLSALGDGEARRLVAVRRQLEGPRAAERRLADDLPYQQPRLVAIDDLGLVVPAPALRRDRV